MYATGNCSYNEGIVMTKYANPEKMNDATLNGHIRMVSKWIGELSYHLAMCEDERNRRMEPEIVMEEYVRREEIPEFGQTFEGGEGI